MFQLSKEEFAVLKSQIVTSNQGVVGPETKRHTTLSKLHTDIDRQWAVLMIRGMYTQMAHVKVKTFGWLTARRIVPVRPDILI